MITIDHCMKVIITDHENSRNIQLHILVFLTHEIFQIEYSQEMSHLASFFRIFYLSYFIEYETHQRILITWKIIIIDQNFHAMINSDNEMLVFTENIFHTFFSLLSPNASIKVRRWAKCDICRDQGKRLEAGAGQRRLFEISPLDRRS